MLVFAAQNRQRNTEITPAHKNLQSKTELEKSRQKKAPRHNSVFLTGYIVFVLNYQFTIFKNLYAIIISTNFCIIKYSGGEL